MIGRIEFANGMRRGDMNVKCKKCGGMVTVADDTVIGQLATCPSCGRKFTCGIERGGILEDDVRLALDVSRKDPANDDYYGDAPDGARRFIELVFYGNCFKASLDVKTYLAAFDEIGLALTEKDVAYLLRFETNESMRKYLTDRRTALIAGMNEGHGNANGTRQTGRSSKIGLIRPSPTPHNEIAQAPRRGDPLPARNCGKSSQVGKLVEFAAILAVVFVGGWFVGETWKDEKPAEQHTSESKVVVQAQTTDIVPHENACQEKPEPSATQLEDERERALESFGAYLAQAKEPFVDTVRKATTAISETLGDWERLSEALMRIDAENTQRAKTASANGWVRFDKAEMVMMILKDKDMNELAAKYLGEDFTALRTECRGKIKAALDARKEAAKRLPKNRVQQGYQQEVAEEDADTETSKAQEITLQVNKELEMRLQALEGARNKMETELKRLKAIDRKSQWVVTARQSVQDEIAMLDREITRMGDVAAVSRNNLAKMIAATEAALSARKDEGNAVRSGLAHDQAIDAIAVDYEARSLDKLCAALSERKGAVAAKAKAAQTKLEFIRQSSVNADLMRPDEIEELKKKIVAEIGEKTSNSL